MPSRSKKRETKDNIVGSFILLTVYTTGTFCYALRLKQQAGSWADLSFSAAGSIISHIVLCLHQASALLLALKTAKKPDTQALVAYDLLGNTLLYQAITLPLLFHHEVQDPSLRVPTLHLALLAVGFWKVFFPPTPLPWFILDRLLACPLLLASAFCLDATAPMGLAFALGNVPRNALLCAAHSAIMVLVGAFLEPNMASIGALSSATRLPLPGWVCGTIDRSIGAAQSVLRACHVPLGRRYARASCDAGGAGPGALQYSHLAVSVGCALMGALFVLYDPRSGFLAVIFAFSGAFWGGLAIGYAAEVASEGANAEPGHHEPPPSCLYPSPHPNPHPAPKSLKDPTHPVARFRDACTRLRRRADIRQLLSEPLLDTVPGLTEAIVVVEVAARGAAPLPPPNIEAIWCLGDGVGPGAGGRPCPAPECLAGRESSTFSCMASRSLVDSALSFRGMDSYSDYQKAAARGLTRGVTAPLIAADRVVGTVCLFFSGNESDSEDSSGGCGHTLDHRTIRAVADALATSILFSRDEMQAWISQELVSDFIPRHLLDHLAAEAVREITSPRDASASGLEGDTLYGTDDGHLLLQPRFPVPKAKRPGAFPDGLLESPFIPAFDGEGIDSAYGSSSGGKPSDRGTSSDAMPDNFAPHALRTKGTGHQRRLAPHVDPSAPFHAAHADADTPHAVGDPWGTQAPPRSAAAAARVAESSLSVHADVATILVADLVDYAQLSSELDPRECLFALHTFFTLVDQEAEALGVCKMDTVGSMYICSAGLVAPDAEHAATMLRLAVAMSVCAAGVRLNGAPLRLRIGIASAPNMVTGLVGSIRKKFVAHGAALDAAAHLERTCRPGMIHMSDFARQTADVRSNAPGMIERLTRCGGRLLKSYQVDAGSIPAALEF